MPDWFWLGGCALPAGCGGLLSVGAV